MVDLNAFYTSDAFGEKGRSAAGVEGAVPPSAILHIELELVSWKTVTEVTDDKKVLKKILKEGEGYERPNEGAVVKGILQPSITHGCCGYTFFIYHFTFEVFPLSFLVLTICLFPFNLQSS